MRRLITSGLTVALAATVGCAPASPSATEAPTAPPATATLAPASAAPTAAPTEAATAPPVATPPATDAPEPTQPDETAPEPSQGEPATPEPPPAEATPIPVVIGPPSDVPIVPPAPEPDAERRLRHRMDIDQLNQSIRRATGGIGWTELQSDGTELDLFEDLSLTLGRPDYIDSTQEDLAPSLLFQKFLGDAARQVCDRLVERELGQSEGDRVLMVHIGPGDDPIANPTATEANLRMLLLRFHGRAVDPGSPALNPWSWLVESTLHVSDAQPVTAWEAVCVGLITHPDFYTY